MIRFYKFSSVIKQGRGSDTIYKVVYAYLEPLVFVIYPETKNVKVPIYGRLSQEIVLPLTVIND